MEKLMKAKEEIMNEIMEIENTPIEIVIENKVKEYRESITKEAEEQRKKELEELHIGLKYISRAIDKAILEIPQEVTQKIEENTLTQIVI